MAEALAPGGSAVLRDWRPHRSKVAPGVAPGRGRCLYATEAISAGEVIDRACSIELSSAPCDLLEEILPLGDYYFRHPADAERGLLLLGLVSLVNHSEDPNVEIRFNHAEGIGWIAEMVALRDIAPPTEILHRYRCPPWFEIT